MGNLAQLGMPTLSLQGIVTRALESSVSRVTAQGDFSRTCFLVSNWLLEFPPLLTETAALF